MNGNPTNMNPDEFISYLAKHGIMEYEYKQDKDEISFPCPFCHGDDDHRDGEEFHCGFNLSNCVYFCLKCGEKGNFVTLRKHFGDYGEQQAKQKTQRRSTNNDTKTAFQRKVLEAFNNTHEKAEVREYLNGRGINSESIKKCMLGLWKYNGQDRIMIPVFNKDNEIAYLKLRRTPVADVIANEMDHGNSEPKYVVYPAGASVILVGEDQLSRSSSSDVLICEGEFDRIIAIQEGVKMPVVTSGGGALTFKDEWIDELNNGERAMRNIYICMDKDEAGLNGAKKLAERLSKRIPEASVYMISLPFEENTHADLTDYFVQKKGTADELFTKYSSFYCGAKPIDPSQFKEMTVDDIAKTLETTIKYDFVCKTVAFLAMVLAYTESDQLNVMFNAESSTGKTYDCLEVSKYFPHQDVLPYGKTTPTAFYYNRREIDEKTGQSYVDLERRILIFMDQPDSQLQANMRPLLSHDSKKIPYAITNRGKGGKNVADEGYLLGFCSTFFCSANMNVDEQEQTRCLVVSPDSTREKLLAGIDACIDRSTDKAAYDAKLDKNFARKQLMERVLYIKSLHVGYINIADSDYLKEKFMEGRKALAPKVQRDISHFISLVKAMALVNAPFRMKDGMVFATKKDIDEALKLWTPLSESDSYGISPQAYDFYKKYILGKYCSKSKGSVLGETFITNKELVKEYYDQTGCYPNDDNLRKNILPALAAVGLIEYRKAADGEGDKRCMVIIPLVFPDGNLEK